MPLFTKRPVTIEAHQLPSLDEDASEELIDFLCNDNILSDRDGGVLINTLEGAMRGDPGDWIIKGLKGEYYPCKNDIFEASYMSASDEERTHYEELREEQFDDNT